MSLRFYLVTTDNELLRLPNDHHNRCYPQLVSSRQRYIEYWWTDRDDNSMRDRLTGSYAEFDANGQFDRVAAAGRAMGALEAYSARQDAEVIRKSPAPNIRNMPDYERKAADLIEQNRWTVPDEIRERIEFDVMGSKRPRGTTPIPILKPKQEA